MSLRNVSLGSIGALGLLLVIGLSQPTWAQKRDCVVRLTGKPGSTTLSRNGKPYFIKGVGGTGSRKLLLESGANSVRTWGADNAKEVLDEAQKAGLTVTLGIWLGHCDVFDYHNADIVNEQLKMCLKVVDQFKNHPALLMWAFGNEMEGYGKADDPAVWKAVNDIARACKSLDPNHPTMTVVSEIGGDRVKNFHAFCADVDILGINSYGGAPTLGERYEKAGGRKPYILTEFGTPGSWESPKTRWDAPIEPSSTAKGESYRRSYQSAVLDQKGRCLGSYAFLWGNKQEATATWFGMFLPDGSRLAATDVMTQFWAGRAPKNPVPTIESLTVSNSDHLRPGETVSAKLQSSARLDKTVTVKWVLTGETTEHLGAGQDEAVPVGYPDAILESSQDQAKVKLPSFGGPYRLFVYLFDTHGGAAVANVPLFVDGPGQKYEGTVPRLPVAIVAEPAMTSTFVPSGWMGNTGALTADFDCNDTPHTGKTCLKFSYGANSGWAGIAWQYPANDWGDLPLAIDLSKAKRLTFWARGQDGGEKATVSFGIIKKGHKYLDSGSVTMEVTLSKVWKEFEIDLTGLDLKTIKTGFVVTVASSGNPVTIFFDDVVYTDSRSS